LRKIYLLSPTKSKFKDVENFPTIETEFIDREIDLRGFDTLIFTSKVAVQSIDRIDKSWKKFPAISVGKKTSSEIFKLGGEILHTVEKGGGKEIVKDIIESFRERRFLYVRPEKVATNISKELRTFGVYIDEVTLYKTICKDKIEFEIKENSIVVVSSPSTIECLFKNINVPQNTVFIAIGKKTLAKIPANFEAYLSQEESLESCIYFAKDFLHK
jgi:uroporphyrinogen-III synthase